MRAVSRFQAIVSAVVEPHGGRVVKFLGDGALAEFPSTEQAVRSADAHAAPPSSYPLAAIRLNILGYILWNAGRSDESLVTLRRAYAIDSTLRYVNRSIWRMLLCSGRYAEAEVFMQEVGRSLDDRTRRVTRALAAADTAAAIEILRADTLVGDEYYLSALVGDPGSAIAALAKGAFGGPFGPPDAMWDPTLARYRDDPRFRELVRSRNLTPP